MNDPWDVKSVRQSNQYMSFMKINGIPLLPPVLSKECRKEMQYYRLLAKEVEKRIQSLKPLVIESDTESNDDKTDAPDLPESEQNYEIHLDNENGDINNKCLEECTDRLCTSNTYDNLSATLTPDTDSVSSKLVIDMSLSINDTGKHLLESGNTSQTPNDVPERDYVVLQKNFSNSHNNNTIKDEKLSFSLSLNKDAALEQGAIFHFSQEGPSSLSSKSFTGSLNDIHTESVKESSKPLIRQRSYTLLKPSPVLLAHLEVQSLNTGVDVTSISMSESMSNISYFNRKRRSWDLESAKEKWSTMALELKGKNISQNIKIRAKSPMKKTIVTKRTTQSMPPRSKSLAVGKVRCSPPKPSPKSDPIHKPKKTPNPGSNPAQNVQKSPTTQQTNQKKEIEGTKKSVSESEDPATRVRELYEKIQKQQVIQMANLVEKQKKEQILLQQVFEEQNHLLFTQLKTICPKSPNEVKDAWHDKIKETEKGPVSLSQLINHKSTESNCEGPPITTLAATNNYINYCDNVLSMSRDITSSLKKQVKAAPENDKTQRLNDGSRTRTHSPIRKNTPTSRKLVYETSMPSERDYDPILTDRTNDTMADLNVTFPSDEECQPYLHNTVIMCGPVESPIQHSVSCRTADKPLKSVDNTIQHSIKNISMRPNIFRAPTAHEQAAATKIVASAKGFLVRRLMRTERVQATVQTIKDALLCALQLHQDREGIRGADVDLHRRLIQQITAACYSLHDTFIASGPAERCGLIAADRSRRRSLAARASPLSHRDYRPTDVMSQSHSGVFPTRAKRVGPSLMTQSNYETFSKDRTVRRYMPSPRRRPWR